MLRHTEYSKIDISFYDRRYIDIYLICFPSDKLIRACGSPGYVSPELIRLEGYNCATDMFSAGIIFAEMLTGLPLFTGSNPKSTL